MSAHWKAVELKVADYLGEGHERVPVTGRTGARGQETPDIISPFWSLELKHKDSVPKWLRYAMDQSKASLKPEHIAPVAIIHPKGSRIDQALCIMPLESLKKIQGLLD